MTANNSLDTGGAVKGISMNNGVRQGTLVLSIDLELDLEHHDGTIQRRLDEVRSRLVSITRSHGIPATWAVADPMLSAASESILTAGCGHEIAVLGDQAWLGPGCGRARLARELARRFSAPRKAGIPVTTVALRNVEQVADLDLLIAHGVTGLCGPATPDLSSLKKLAPAPIRFGLWQPPAAWTLSPQTHAWSPQMWRLRGEIKRAIKKQSLLHLRIEALRFVDAPNRTLDIFETVCRYIAAKRDVGRLAIRTIGDLASEALSNRAAVSSRSILRPAA
jgi:hypothetical protein